MSDGESRDDLRTDLHDGVLTVTIDRPGSKNALTVAMRQRLERICLDVDARGDVAALVLTGVEDVFCAGADVKEISRLAGDLPSTNPGAALRGVAKPTIAAVNGICITGGLELALSCDWIVASDQAVFADTHAQLGVLPRWGLSALLPAAVGTARAKEMTLTGRKVTAAEAHDMGLTAQVYAHEGFHAAVHEHACVVAGVGRHAAVETLGLYDAGAGQPVTTALGFERDRSETFQSEPGALGNS